jgi:hypothetical protein
MADGALVERSHLLTLAKGRADSLRHSDRIQHAKEAHQIGKNRRPAHSVQRQKAIRTRDVYSLDGLVVGASIEADLPWAWHAALVYNARANSGSDRVRDLAAPLESARAHVGPRGNQRVSR